MCLCDVPARPKLKLYSTDARFQHGTHTRLATDDVEASPQPTFTVTELVVSGMCCQSEVLLIEKKLGQLDGVMDLKFNLLMRRVAVTYDADKVTGEQMLRPLNWSCLGASVVQKSGGKGGIQRGELCSRATLVALAILVLFVLAGGVWGRSESTSGGRTPSRTLRSRASRSGCRPSCLSVFIFRIFYKLACCERSIQPTSQEALERIMSCCTGDES